MTEPDLVGLFIEPLERLGLRYMVTGGVAAVIYGDPRFTRGVDVVLELGSRDVERLLGAFSGSAFYTPPEEVLSEEASRAGGRHFNLIHHDTALRADVYLAGSHPLHGWAMEHRRRLRVGGGEIWVAPVEYVILRKLEYHRASGSERHLRDVAMMLRVSGDVVDDRAVEDWSARLGVAAELDRARRYEP